MSLIVAVTLLLAICLVGAQPDCFSDCGTLEECAASQEIECEANQYCALIAYSLGPLTRRRALCRDLSGLDRCLEMHDDNDDDCDPQNPPTGMCTWCCDDAQCISDVLAGGNPSANTAAPATLAPTAAPGPATAAPTAAPGPATAAPTAAPVPATAAPTAAPVPATAAPTTTEKPPRTKNPNHPSNSGNPNSNAGANHLKDVKTESVHHSASCRNMYTGDCSVDFAGRCGELIVRQICQRQCGTCN